VAAPQRPAAHEPPTPGSEAGSPAVDGRTDDGEPARLDVGRVVKPHGMHGEVVVERWTNVEGRFDPGARFGAREQPGGAPVHELTVAASRPQGHRLLVRFEHVDDRGGAERLRGTVLSAAPLESHDELWIHELVGASVVTTVGDEVGTVTAVEANPASDLLVLSTGALVPARFVVSRAPDGRLIVELPEGLLE